MNPQEEYERLQTEQGYFVTDKVVFRLTGDVYSLLHGLMTQVLEAPMTAFVDKQGKLIALADQFKASMSEHYLASSAMAAAALETHLRYYQPYSQAKLEKTDLKAIYFFNDTQHRERAIPQARGVLGFVASDLPLEGVAISPELFKIIRLESGIALQGVEFTNPMLLETGIDQVVSYTKGCYLGQEVIARVHYKGKPKRKLVRLLFDRLPEVVTVKGQKVGEIITSGFSPRFKKHVAFAMIEKYDEAIDGGGIIS